MSSQVGFSGKNVSEVTVESIRRGDITLDDVRIHPNTLVHQAKDSIHASAYRIRTGAKRGALQLLSGRQSEISSGRCAHP